MSYLFVLRKTEPNMERPFTAPFYPVFPAIALIITFICLLAFVYYNMVLSLVFLAGLALVILLFLGMGKHKVKLTGSDMVAEH